jgi:hypothetical protein
MAVPSYDAEQRIVAHREHQPPRKIRRGSAAESKSEMMDDVVEPSGSPRPWRQQIVVKSLGKDLPTTEHGITVKPTGPDQQPYRTPSDGEIRQTPKIAAVYPFGTRPAFRAGVGPDHGTDGDHHACAISRDPVHDKTARDQ